jgi:hypothetical protein
MNDSNPVDITDDLEAFETEFYGLKPDQPEPEPEPDDEDDLEGADPEDDSLEADDDEPEEEDEDADPEPEPEPKPKKKSAQERIKELTAKAREAERREAELLKRLEKLEAPKEVPATPEPSKASEGAPDPDAKDADGEAKYPLGEFDPQYIRDLARFTVAEETRSQRQAYEQERSQQQLLQGWTEKVAEVEKEIPDLRENLEKLSPVFDGADEGFSDYLAQTIMGSDVGPQVMYYLSQNIGEAQRLVASGPAAATLMIGRLEARFLSTSEEKKQQKKVSKAPTPPESRVRGNSGRFQIAPDTDDLDAFEKLYFSKR